MLGRVVFEAEASGGSKAGGLPTLSFPLSLSSPFPFPVHPFLASEREGQIQWREFPGSPPPTNTTLVLGAGLSVIETLSCVQVVSVGEASPVLLVFQDQRVPLVQLVRLVIKFR